MMNQRRSHCPPDILFVLQSFLIMDGVVILSATLFPVVEVFRRPTSGVWIACAYEALLAAVLGALLLLLAKIPQYRAGNFSRIGSSHLPPRSQQLHRLAFVLIVPSCPVLIALLLVAHRVA